MTISCLSERPLHVRLATLYLTAALLLHHLLQALPSRVEAAGLFGVLNGHTTTVVAPQLAWAALLALTLVSSLVCFFSGQFMRIHQVSSGCTIVSLAKLPFRRLIPAGMLGLCLLHIDQVWMLSAFLVVLLSCLQHGLRGPRSARSFQRLGELLWQVRVCWFVTLFEKSLDAPINELESSLALLLILPTFLLGPTPRLSFAYTLLSGKPTPQVAFESQLWFLRLERIALAGLLFCSAGKAVFHLLLPYALGRLALVVALRLISRRGGWPQVLHSTEGPWIDIMAKILPDRYSLDAERGVRSTEVKPVDRFGDGPLLEPVEPAPRRCARPPSPPPLEAVIGFLVLFSTLAPAVVPNLDTLRAGERLTYRTRIVKDTLYHCDSSVATQKLFSSLPQSRMSVALGAEAETVGCLLIAALCLGIFFSFRGSALGMWGLPDTGPNRAGLGICVSVLTTITLAALLGWLWLPWEAGLLCLLCIGVVTHHGGSLKLSLYRLQDVVVCSDHIADVFGGFLSNG